MKSSVLLQLAPSSHRTDRTGFGASFHREGIYNMQWRVMGDHHTAPELLPAHSWSRKLHITPTHLFCYSLNSQTLTPAVIFALALFEHRHRGYQPLADNMGNVSVSTLGSSLPLVHLPGSTDDRNPTSRRKTRKRREDKSNLSMAMGEEKSTRRRRANSLLRRVRL